MFSRFFRPQHQVKDPAAKEMHYVYVKGVAYRRCGHLIAMCDYTLPPREQRWKLILNADDNPQITQIAYALGLIEGMIEVRSKSSSAGIGLN